MPNLSKDGLGERSTIGVQFLVVFCLTNRGLFLVWMGCRPHFPGPAPFPMAIYFSNRPPRSALGAKAPVDSAKRCGAEEALAARRHRPCSPAFTVSGRPERVKLHVRILVVVGKHVTFLLIVV